MRKKLCNRGFSLAEVVIALAMISLVTITAFSIVLSSAATKANAINRSEAISFADNMRECFQTAETEAEFLSLVNFAENVMLTNSEIDATGSTTYTYYSGKENFRARITVRYHQNLRPELSITIVNKNGANIISFSYQKEDGI